MLRKLECFKHAIVVGDVTSSVAHLRIRACAPFSLEEMIEKSYGNVTFGSERIRQGEYN